MAKARKAQPQVKAEQEDAPAFSSEEAAEMQDAARAARAESGKEQEKQRNAQSKGAKGIGETSGGVSIPPAVPVRLAEDAPSGEAPGHNEEDEGHEGAEFVVPRPPLDVYGNEAHVPSPPMQDLDAPDVGS